MGKIISVKDIKIPSIIIDEVTLDEVDVSEDEFHDYPQFDIECSVCGDGDGLGRMENVRNSRQAVNRYAKDGWTYEYDDSKIGMEKHIVRCKYCTNRYTNN